MPKLSIVMACYDDFRGLLWTIQALKTHGRVLADVELVVLNNNPLSKDGQSITNFVNGQSVAKGAAVKQSETDKGFLTDWDQWQFHSVKVVDASQKTGTAYPRNLGFSVASGEIVMCIDSHVVLLPGAIDAVLKFYRENPDFDGLVHGPMLYDQYASHASSMTDTWGAEMWGQWQADEQARDPDSPPFEIQAMGMGLWACRKDAWLGFHPGMEGFGGEEWTIHEKYRKHGRKVLCLPKLRWWHDFSDRPRAYPLKREHKIRNYLFAMVEIGLPTDRMKAHFASDSFPMERLDQIEAEVRAGMGSNIQPYSTMEDAYREASEKPSDINEHIPRLRELASKVRHVTEFGVRTGVSTAGLLAGPAGREGTKLCSYDINPSPDVDRLRGVAGCEFVFTQGDVLSVDIETTDLLFIDSLHTGERVSKELARHAGKVRQFIAFHDTQIYGETGEDGRAGILHAIRGFLATHPQWRCIESRGNNHGFMVLSRDPSDFPNPPVPVPTGPMIVTAPEQGVGSEFKEIVAGLGFQPSPGCGCNSLMQQMNRAGVAGCRKSFFTFVGQLKDNGSGYGWGSMLQAAFWAAMTGLAFKVNPLDPIPGLFEEAIRRAEVKGFV